MVRQRMLLYHVQQPPSSYVSSSLFIDSSLISISVSRGTKAMQFLIILFRGLRHASFPLLFLTA
jgi:hypothetical protein